MNVQKEFIEWLNKKTHSYETALAFHNHIQDKNPQINYKTKVQFTSDDKVHLYIPTQKVIWKHNTWTNKKGLKGRLLRAFGELLNNRNILFKGKELFENPFISKEIELLSFAEYGFYDHFNNRTTKVRLVYHPQSDTLFVQDK